MKRMITTLILLFIVATSVNAQNYNEWFRQKYTQRKYLLEQIAALKVYGEYAKKGYGIVKNGLDGISGEVLTEYKLHQDYFNGRKTVSPSVKNYQGTADAIELYDKIMKDCGYYLRYSHESKYLLAHEKDYVIRVLNRVRQDCDAARQALKVITTSYNIEMSDAERIERIEAICKEMRDRYDFCRRFGTDLKTLATSRRKSENEIRKSRELFGTNQ